MQGSDDWSHFQFMSAKVKWAPQCCQTILLHLLSPSILLNDYLTVFPLSSYLQQLLLPSRSQLMTCFLWEQRILYPHTSAFTRISPLEPVCLLPILNEQPHFCLRKPSVCPWILSLFLHMKAFSSLIYINSFHSIKIWEVLICGLHLMHVKVLGSREALVREHLRL